MKYWKHRFVWASALALATTLTSQVTTLGQTNGVIMIVTRYEQDLSWLGEDGDICDGMKVTGGGQCSQGDVAMAELLGDYGYPTRVIIDMELQLPDSPYGRPNPYTTYEPNPVAYLAGGSSIPYTTPNPDYKACLIIQSGSANSSHAPLLATNGVPYMCGEQAILSDRANKPGSIFMYSNGGQSDDDAGTTLSTNQWMKVTAAGKLHPIMQGIPLDANDCVKIYRDPYPEEVTAHRPVGCNPLWQWDIPFQFTNNAAPGTTVLGLMGSDYTKSIFAVVAVGGELSNGKLATARLVHYYVCEGGQDSYRRVFNSLSDLGRVIFVRAAKWAMGETLPAYQPLGIIKVARLNATQIQLAWTGTATKNYKILGTSNLFGPDNYLNWQTVAQDIPGVNGVDATTAKLDISAGPQYAYLRVMPVP
jgi:hypothetical protein